jgi:3-oxoadipate enol-lactonase
MATAQVGETTLSFQSAGEGEPVVFIHGALIADAFLSLVKEPSLKDYRLITYHRRGYRDSSLASPSLSISDQAEDCFALTRFLGVEQFHVVGHSFGGVVAVELAKVFPEVVHTVALLEPALMIGASAEGYRQSLTAGVDRFHNVGALTAVDEMLGARWPQYRSKLSSVLPHGFDDAVAAAPAAFEAELPSLFDWHFTEADAVAVRQPVLSVLGGESHTLSPRFLEVHDWLLTHVADAQGFVLPNAHHFLQLENSHDMAQALASFWKRHPIEA